MSRKKMAHFDELPPEEPVVRTMTDLVKHIENTLGWCPAWDDPRPVWKVRSIEVGKMKRVCQRDPKLYTMDNLLLAVDYLRRHRRPVKTPVGVCYAVEDALKERGRTRSEAAVEERLGAAREVLATMPDTPERRTLERRLAVARGSQLIEALEEVESL